MITSASSTRWTCCCGCSSPRASRCWSSRRPTPTRWRRCGRTGCGSARQTSIRDTGWDEGMLLSAIRGGAAHLAYLIPEFQNPSGHLMPASLRERLAAAAHAAGTDLIVDESFVDLRLGTDETAPEMPPPVAAFDRHARVLTVGGMSKPYWGGLRVGWIRAAAPVIARLSALRVAVDMAGPVLDQLVALRLLAHRDDVIRDRRAQLTRQRDRLVAALRAHLPEWSFTVPSGGACLWVELDAPVSSALAQSAIAHGLIVASGPRFGVDGTLERYLGCPSTCLRTSSTRPYAGWPRPGPAWTVSTRSTGPRRPWSPDGAWTLEGVPRPRDGCDSSPREGRLRSRPSSRRTSSRCPRRRWSRRPCA